MDTVELYMDALELVLNKLNDHTSSLSSKRICHRPTDWQYVSVLYKLWLYIKIHTN